MSESEVAEARRDTAVHDRGDPTFDGELVEVEGIFLEKRDIDDIDPAFDDGFQVRGAHGTGDCAHSYVVAGHHIGDNRRIGKIRLQRCDVRQPVEPRKRRLECIHRGDLPILLGGEVFHHRLTHTTATQDNNLHRNLHRGNYGSRILTTPPDVSSASVVLASVSTPTGRGRYKSRLRQSDFFADPGFRFGSTHIGRVHQFRQTLDQGFLIDRFCEHAIGPPLQIMPPEIGPAVVLDDGVVAGEDHDRNR